MPYSALRLYFENPVGRLLENSKGYAVVEYKAGERKLSDLQAFLHHASQLLARNNCNKLLGDQRTLIPSQA